MESIDLRPFPQTSLLSPTCELSRDPWTLPIEQTHLTHRSELRAHLRADDKASRYRHLLTDFGIDANTDGLASLRQSPKLLFAEQPGCWYTRRDAIRLRLLNRLIDDLDFDRELSGVWTLANDGFTADGDKGCFLKLDFHAGLGPVNFLGSPFIRRHKRRTYSALRINGSTLDRMQQIFTYCDRMLRSATISPQTFVREISALLNRGVPSGLASLLPPSRERGILSSWGERLAIYDLKKAADVLAEARQALVPNVAWSDFWNAANTVYLATFIRPLSPILNRFLLAVADPVRMSQRLIGECGRRLDQPISIAGIVTDDDIYRIVFFEPRDESFFFQRGNREKCSISWHEVRQLAADNRAGGPSGILEYLLLAACGFYLLVDSGDGMRSFHRKACQIHQRYTGLKYPWITFTVDGDFARGYFESNSFLEVYHPDFEETCHESMVRFMVD